jgi:hypothetical protein
VSCVDDRYTWISVLMLEEVGDLESLNSLVLQNRS